MAALLAKVDHGPAAVLLDDRDQLMRERLRDEVIVTLKAGGVFRGVLFDADQRSVVLRNTVMLDEGNTASQMPVDGELVLARSDVHYLQRP